MGGQSGGQQRGQVLVEQQPHAARGEKVRRSRSAAKAKQARMSSWVSAGNSARSSDSGVPAARYPRTSYTVMRVSRMHGFPFRRPGLMVIRSSKFTPERCPRWARMTRRRWVAEAENWKTGESGNWETGTNKACASCVSWRQIRMAAKRRSGEGGERREARGEFLVGSAVPADRNLGEVGFGLSVTGEKARPMWLRLQPRKIHARPSRKPEVRRTAACASCASWRQIGMAAKRRRRRRVSLGPGAVKHQAGGV